MTPDAILTLGIFLLAQTGLLIWKLSAIDTKQASMKETLNRLELSAHASELHLATLPCRTCEQLSAGE